jgi:hypothetical protein
VNTLARRIGIVAWPAFVTAGVLEMFVFAFVEPGSLHTLDGSALELSAVAVYSIAFFVFWALVALACLLALRLACSADEINAPAVGGEGRRAGG